MPSSGAPKISTRPRLGARRPAAALSKVDLPQPLGPTIATKRPSGMSRVISVTATKPPAAGASNRISTSRNATAGAADVARGRGAAPLIAMSAARPESRLLLGSALLRRRRLDEGVGVGLCHVDLGLGDGGVEAREHVVHGLRALGVHQTGLREHRDRVGQRREIELRIAALVVLG